MADRPKETLPPGTFDIPGGRGVKFIRCSKPSCQVLSTSVGSSDLSAPSASAAPIVGYARPVSPVSPVLAVATTLGTVAGIAVATLRTVAGTAGTAVRPRVVNPRVAGMPVLEIGPIPGFTAAATDRRIAVAKRTPASTRFARLGFTHFFRRVAPGNWECRAGCRANLLRLDAALADAALADAGLDRDSRGNKDPSAPAAPAPARMSGPATMSGPAMREALAVTSVRGTSTTALAVTTGVSMTAGMPAAMPTSAMPATCASVRSRRCCRERHKCERHDRNHNDRKFAKHTSPLIQRLLVLSLRVIALITATPLPARNRGEPDRKIELF
jgi:hypothetical protein